MCAQLTFTVIAALATTEAALNVGVVINPPLAYWINESVATIGWQRSVSGLPIPDGWIDGLVPRLIAASINVPVQLYALPEVEAGGQVPGAVGALLAGQVNMSCLLPVGTAPLQLKFSTPVFVEEIDMLAPTRSLKRCYGSPAAICWWDFAYPLTLNAWIALFAVFIVSGIAIFWLDRLSPYGSWSTNRARKELGHHGEDEMEFSGPNVAFLVSMLALEKEAEVPRSLSARTATVALLFVLMLAVSLYEAGLTRLEVSRSLRFELSDFSQLLQRGWHFAAVDANTYDFIQWNPFAPTRRLRRLMVPLSNTGAPDIGGVQNVMEGLSNYKDSVAMLHGERVYALLGGKSQLQYHFARIPEDAVAESVGLTPISVGSQFLACAVLSNPGRPILDVINELNVGIAARIEDGSVEAWLHAGIHAPGYVRDASDLSADAGGSQSDRGSDSERTERMAGLYLAFVAGMAFAWFVLLIEHRVGKYASPPDGAPRRCRALCTRFHAMFANENLESAERFSGVVESDDADNGSDKVPRTSHIAKAMALQPYPAAHGGNRPVSGVVAVAVNPLAQREARAPATNITHDGSVPHHTALTPLQQRARRVSALAKARDMLMSAISGTTRQRRSLTGAPPTPGSDVSHPSEAPGLSIELASLPSAATGPRVSRPTSPANGSESALDSTSRRLSGANGAAVMLPAGVEHQDAKQGPDLRGPV